jgi:hypothetical protein
LCGQSLDLAKNDAARARKEYQDLADGKKDREFDKKVGAQFTVFVLIGSLLFGLP